MHINAFVFKICWKRIKCNAVKENILFKSKSKNWHTNLPLFLISVILEWYLLTKLGQNYFVTHSIINISLGLESHIIYADNITLNLIFTHKNVIWSPRMISFMIVWHLLWYLFHNLLFFNSLLPKLYPQWCFCVEIWAHNILMLIFARQIVIFLCRFFLLTKNIIKMHFFFQLWLEPN